MKSDDGVQPSFKKVAHLFMPSFFMTFVHLFMNRMFDRSRTPIRGDTLVDSTRLLLMIHMTAGKVINYGRGQGQWTAAIFCVLCLLAINRKWRRAVITIALFFQLYRIYEIFPLVANHFWIEMFLLFTLAMIDNKEEDNALYRQFARWLIVIILFYSGLQKCWYGTYFDGRYIATKIALFENYRQFFAIFIPAEEVARLVSYAPIRDGSGPFRIESLLGLIVINSIWIVEILAAILLFFRRTRFIGIIFTFFIIFGIEIIARELFFGVLFVVVLSSFLRTDFVRKLTVPILLFYIYLICTVFIPWVPGFRFLL